MSKRVAFHELCVCVALTLSKNNATFVVKTEVMTLPQTLTSNRSIKISEDLYRVAKWTANAENRSISGQIEFWAKLGRAAVDNPDLPIDFIRETLIAKALDRALAEPFKPE